MRINPGMKQNEPTYQVVLDALALTTCYLAFLIIVEVHVIYMHQLWGQFFDETPTEEEALSFIHDRGHTREISLVGNMRFISRHADTQVYGAILPPAMMNRAMLDSIAYKTCHAIDLGAESPKSRKVGFIIRDTPDVSVSKKKAPSKGDNGKCSSGTDDGTGIKAGVLDVPKYDLESETESSDRATKRRKASKDAESSKEQNSKESKSSCIFKDASRTQHKSFGKSAHAEEPSHTVYESRVRQNQEYETGHNDEQPKEEATPKSDWFKKPKRPPTPDPDWSKRQLVEFRPPQTWISDVARFENPPTSFNELMDTSFAFSAFVMNRLNITDLT
nr:hypothetical protein [Tanacetum cinerariifolium]